jgi:hypothetical protein
MEHLSKKSLTCIQCEQFAGQRFARLTGAKCDVVGIFPGEFRRLTRSGASVTLVRGSDGACDWSALYG